MGNNVFDDDMKEAVAFLDSFWKLSFESVNFFSKLISYDTILKDFIDAHAPVYKLNPKKLRKLWQSFGLPHEPTVISAELANSLPYKSFYLEYPITIEGVQYKGLFLCFDLVTKDNSKNRLHILFVDTCNAPLDDDLILPVSRHLDYIRLREGNRIVHILPIYRSRYILTQIIKILYLISTGNLEPNYLL